MAREGAGRKLSAILSADVVGYSRLMAEDEAGTIRTLTSYRSAITGLVQDHRGRVVDAPGDNLLAEFPTALDAVECAAEIQRVLAARNAGLPEGRRMEFRIGVHLGDVAVEGERIYGDGVNVAARLEGLAEPGGVCISDDVLHQVQRALQELARRAADALVCLLGQPLQDGVVGSGQMDRDSISQHLVGVLGRSTAQIHLASPTHTERAAPVRY
jgi:class 3 adenylate cyclase